MFGNLPGQQTWGGHSRSKEIKIGERILCQDIHNNNTYKRFCIGGGGSEQQEERHLIVLQKNKNIRNLLHFNLASAI